MSDGIVRGIFQQANVRAVVCVATQTAATAANLHELHSGSAALLGQGLLSGLLLAALQKGEQHINLQLECDGPLRGMLVDAGADGSVRGYVKNRYLDVVGSPGAFHWRPLLGNSGFLSVLKDVGSGEYYRSSVELNAMELGIDLERYFAQSEQVATRLTLCEGPHVAGVLLQALPGTSPDVVDALAKASFSKLQTVSSGGPASAQTLTSALFGDVKDFELLETYPIQWRCTCSKQRVLTALTAMGKSELQHMLEHDKGAKATCQFCGQTHQATEADLKELLAKLPPQA